MNIKLMDGDLYSFTSKAFNDLEICVEKCYDSGKWLVKKEGKDGYFEAFETHNTMEEAFNSALGEFQA